MGRRDSGLFLGTICIGLILGGLWAARGTFSASAPRTTPSPASAPTGAGTAIVRSLTPAPAATPPVVASPSPTPSAEQSPSRLPAAAEPVFVGAEVETSSGNLYYAHRDLATVGDGPGIDFVRGYNSMDTRTGPLGPGWTFTYNAYVVEVSNLGQVSGGPPGTLGNGASPLIAGTSVRVVRRDGRTDYYRLQGTSYIPPPGVSDILQKFTPPLDDGTVYLVTQQDQSTLGFDARGRLIYLKDRSGNKTTLKYNGHDQLISIADPAARGALTLDYDPHTGRLVSVADWLTPPRVVRYAYDDQGRLSAVTDREGNVTRYSYKGDHPWLTTITDANGHAALTIDYYPDGRVSTRVDALGNRKSLTYTRKPDGSQVTVEQFPPSAFEPTWQTEVTDTYDPLGRIIRRVTRPSSSDSPLVEAWTYDARFFRTSATRSGGETARPRGTPTADVSAFPAPGQYVLDPTSQIQQALDAIDGASRVTRDAFGRVTSYVLPREDLPGATEAQRTIHVRYDREDRLRFLDAVDPTTGQRVTTEFRYDPVGNLVDILAPRGQTAHFTYDARDSLVEARTSAGLSVRYTYDDRGDLQRIVAIPSKGAKAVAADYAYDGLHRLRRIVRYPNWPDTTRADVLEYAYDATGRPSAFVSTRP